MSPKIYAHILVSSLCMCIGVLSGEANWYNPSLIGQSDFVPLVGSQTNCPEDSVQDLVGPGNGDHTLLLGTLGQDYFTLIGGRPRQARVIGSNAFQIQCQYWDATLPVAMSLTYAQSTTDGWQNTPTITITGVVIDGGGANLKNMDIRVYASNTPQTPVFTTYTTFTTPTGSPVYQYIGQNGYAYKFEICPRDNADNTCTSWLTSPEIVRIDTVPPDAGNLISVTSQHLLATTNQDFPIQFNDGGAPVKMWYRFEQNSNPSAFDSLMTPDPFSGGYTITRDISQVDIDRSSTTGGRDILWYIDRLCDQAGNCNGTIGGPAALRSLTYTTYANPSFTPSNTLDTSALSNAVADGAKRDILQTIIDGYGNQIIPAPGISRNVRMTLSGINNSMYLNQYTRTGTSSVDVVASTGIRYTLQATGNQDLGLQISTNGEYPLGLEVYTPTANSYPIGSIVSDPGAAVSFRIDLTVIDTLGTNSTFPQSIINPSFGPLYEANISGNLKDGGFIEGTDQSSQINFIKHNPTITTASEALYGEFGGPNKSKFTFAVTPPGILLSDTYAPVVTSFTTPFNITTQLLQNLGESVLNLSSLYFSLHLGYTLNSKDILYNGDIIGKSGGYFGSLQSLGNQYGIKIIGSAGGKIITNITDNQFADSSHFFQGLSVTEMRNTIRKSIAVATRNMILVDVGSVLVDTASLPGGSGVNGSIIASNNASIMALVKPGGVIELGNMGITGKRTLVIRGANLWIRGDMYYTDKSSILGVVLQKDENGNGGNLYIDPSVTNIVGTYMLDGSVMSYDGVTEIGISNINILKNQLYIYGSIFSENTIGGSRMNPPKCPRILNISSCTLDIAQKYDLNYIRRYYLFNGIPFAQGKIIGGGTCSTPISCAGGPIWLQKKFTTLMDPLAEYPVIIEYNPAIGDNLPLGFSIPE